MAFTTLTAFVATLLAAKGSFWAISLTGLWINTTVTTWFSAFGIAVEGSDHAELVAILSLLFCLLHCFFVHLMSSFHSFVDTIETGLGIDTRGLDEGLLLSLVLSFFVSFHETFTTWFALITFVWAVTVVFHATRAIVFAPFLACAFILAFFWHWWFIIVTTEGSRSRFLSDGIGSYGKHSDHK
jgi:hypothetical protein